MNLAGSSFSTYLWHYLLARSIYDHLGVVVITVVVVLVVRARSRR